jgi:hypothetical protein
MENWEKKLEEVLAKENVYSFSDLNHQLIKWVKDWTAVIKNKDGMLASMSHVCNAIEIKTGKQNLPSFIGSVYYMKDYKTDQFILRIIYAVKFDRNKKLMAIFEGVENEDTFYTMVQEDIHLYEEAILEKEFVLGYLTLKFQNFLAQL